MRITVDDVMAMGPCYERERIEEMFQGRDSVTPLDIARAEHVSVKDRLWVLLREKFIPANELHELACRFAESVLPIYETLYPGDDRPRQAIETKRAWLRGHATNEELAAACAAARNAARAAEGAAGAAGAAARAAAGAATGAAEGAAWLAARAAVEREQLAAVEEVLVRLEGAER